MTKPLLTVVTIVRNGKDFVADALDSVISQKTADVEYVVIDGASTDGTLDILRSREGGIDKLISEADRGLYDAKNKGARNGTGEYVAFLNADDFYLPGTLSAVTAELKTSKPDILYGNLHWVQRDAAHLLGQPGLGDHTTLHKAMNVPFPATFIRRELILNSPFDLNFRIAADYDFIFKCFREGRNFKYLNRTLTHMRMGGVSGTHLAKTFQETRDIRLRHGVSPAHVWLDFFRDHFRQTPVGAFYGRIKRSLS